MHRRVPTTANPRVVYSLGEDELRIVRGLYCACLIGSGIWSAAWVCWTFLAGLRGW